MDQDIANLSLSDKNSKNLKVGSVQLFREDNSKGGEVTFNGEKKDIKDIVGKCSNTKKCKSGNVIMISTNKQFDSVNKAPKYMLGSTKNYFYQPIEGVVEGCAILSIIKRDNIDCYGLISEREGKPFSLPGGKMERGETKKQCLTRECREELGYVPNFMKWVTNDSFVTSASSDNKGICHYVLDNTKLKGLTYMSIADMTKRTDIAPYVQRVILDNRMRFMRIIQTDKNKVYIIRLEEGKLFNAIMNNDLPQIESKIVKIDMAKDDTLVEADIVMEVD